MEIRLIATLVLLGLVSGPHTASAAERNLAIKEDKVHVRTWNRFADGIYKLHQQQIQGREINQDTRIGGYMGNPQFYREVTYRDAKSGRHLSRIAWERENPDTIHTIEVFIHDDKGRVIRDYTAAFLPGYRNAPNQTLVSLHNYSGDLHAFRTFDASGNRIYEACEGNLDGTVVDISLEDVDIETALLNPSQGIMATPAYRACFGGLQEQAGKYLNPQ